MYQVRSRGAVSGGLIIGLAILAVVILLVAVGFGSYVSAANYGNSMERRIDAKVADNENVLSSGYQKLKGVAGVTKMATEDQIAIFKAAIEGRYGANGSQQVFLAVKEQNGGTDPQLYRKVQQVVESTQDEFKVSQTQLLDVCRSYETEIGSVWKGMWLGMAGYPKYDKQKCVIVSSDAAADAFKTKRQKAPDFGR